MSHSKSNIRNSSLPRYASYKDSGIEWVEKIPSHWDVKPGRVTLSLNKEKNAGNIEETVLSLSYGRLVIKPHEKMTGLVPESLEGYQIINPGDIIIRPTDLQNDWTSLRVGLAKDRGIITSAYLGLKHDDKISSEYLYYLLHSYDLLKVYYGMGTGLRQNLSWDDFKYLPLTLPPKSEQDRIVAFLDQKTADIDALIAKKQRQIELLDEQKAILINRAVTRGIVNEEFGMRNEHLSSSSHSTFTTHHSKFSPSGIEWIGDIPEHWEVKKLKYASTAIGTGRTPNSVAQAEDLPEGVHWYTPGDYQNNGFLDASERRAKITRSETVETFPAGSLFYIGIGATLGRVNISLHEAGCNQQINVIVINSAAHSSEYMLHLLTSGREFIFSSSDFTTLPILNRSKTAALSIVAPPKDEQEAIAVFCADLILKIQAVQAKVTENIQSLKAFRSTLIAHAVTGRIKV